jgi:hypothetical protein
MQEFRKFIQFTKVEEATRTVYGIATAELPDKDGEICIYADTKPYYQSWSAEAATATSAAGQEISLGNIRLQHGLDIGGKVTGIDYDDANKAIKIRSTPRTDEIWKDLVAGMYTGYSQGGRYIYRNCNECGIAIPSGTWCSKCDKKVLIAYAAAPAEVSYVDSPCLGAAHFEFVRANGTTEVRKFIARKEQPPVANEAKQYLIKSSEPKFALTKDDGQPDRRAMNEAFAALHGWGVKKFEGAGAAEAVTALDEAFAKAGWKTPKQRFEAVKAAAVAKCEQKLAGSKRVLKSMYQVSNFAALLDELNYLRLSALYEREYEGDDSEIPDNLARDIEQLIETFLEMATEETRELVSANKAAGADANSTTKGTSMNQDELLKAARKSLASHFTKSAAHHEKMAAHHEEMAKLHGEKSDMHKAAMKKEDASDDEENTHEIHQMDATFHKAMCKVHEKCAKAHGVMATHAKKMADAHGEEDAEKSAAAFLELAKAVTETPVEKVEPVATQPGGLGGSIAKMVEARVKDSLPDIIGSAEVQEVIQNAVKTQIAAQFGAAIKEDGASLVTKNQIVTRQESTVKKAAPVANHGSMDFQDAGV